MKIASSNIATADYDRNTRVLTMTFINRPFWKYEYQRVPIRVWTDFLRSESKGQYFSGAIRNIYRYKRIIIRN